MIKNYLDWHCAAKGRSENEISWLARPALSILYFEQGFLGNDLNFTAGFQLATWEIDLEFLRQDSFPSIVGFKAGKVELAKLTPQEKIIPVRLYAIWIFTLKINQNGTNSAVITIAAKRP